MKKRLLSTTLAISMALTGTLFTIPAHAKDIPDKTKYLDHSLPIHNGIPSLSRMSIASTSSVYADQAKAISYINSIRKKIGVPAVKLNTKVAKAAQNHADYLYHNGYGNGHGETKGDKYFTGVRFWDRIEKQGVDMSYLGGGEIIAYFGSDHKENIDGFMNTSYHRSSIVDPSSSRVGIGQKGLAFVINFISSENGGDSDFEKDYVYPYNGMKNSPIGFYGFENPNPLEQFNAEESGYIISFTGFAKDVIFDLKDSKGTIIPYYSEVYGDNIFFYPKVEFSYNEEYTASINYTNTLTEKVKTKTWSFTTRKDYYDKSDLWTNEAYLNINGKEAPTIVEENNYNSDRKPIIKNGIAYIESQYIFPRLNGKVNYSSKTGMTVVQTKNKKIAFTTNSKNATVNGKNKTLSQVPIKIGGKVYVPISLLKTTYGIKGSYDKKTRFVSLTGKIDIPYKYSNKVNTMDK